MTERSKSADAIVSGEVILPSQFFRNWRGDRVMRSAEGQLLVAVLADAVDCFQKYWASGDPTGQRLFKDAERWIMEQQPKFERDEPAAGFSFEYVCDVLGIDPDRVRGSLRRWANTRLKSEVMHARA